MARLVWWPNGLRANSRVPLSGPRTDGAEANTTLGGYTQTVSSAFGGWKFQFGFPNLRGQLARRYRGWITSMHGGANATRVPFCDWDGLSLAQMGVNATIDEWRAGQLWSNGQPWSNGKNWASSPPEVQVAANASRDATQVSLASSFWGHGLDCGDMIGFFPFHLGMYMITEVIVPGTYRVWPPLRKAITTDDFATLRPTLAMRMESEDAGSAPRDAFAITGASVTLFEVFDYDVRTYFTD